MRSMEGTKVGFIGAGNMAQAVVKGLLLSGLYAHTVFSYSTILTTNIGKSFNFFASATKETSDSYQKMKVMTGGCTCWSLLVL